MSSSVDYGSADALLPPTEQGPSLDAVPTWRLGIRTRHRGGWNRRMTLLTTGIITITALTAMLTWATSNVGIAPHVTVSLAGTDYRENLRLLPNGFGDRAVGRLAAWSTADPPNARRNIQLSHLPVELSTRASFLEIDTDPTASVCLMFLSAHGVSTPHGPALLAADAPNISEAYPVAELLKTISAFPETQQKVLMLDCTQIVSAPGWGILLNDFSRQLRELETQILEIPNLVVIVASDTDQRSWIHPAAGTTNWSAAILEGLNGGASDLDQDGWIDIADLFHFSRVRTDAWARQTCGLRQQPILLPEGEAGRRRAEAIVLFPDRTPPLEISSQVMPTRSDEIEKWWQRYQTLATRRIHPALTAPVVWRRFEQTLLRFEHFEYAGCRNAAETLHRRLTELADELNHVNMTTSVASRVGVIDPETTGYTVAPELADKAHQVYGLLSEMSNDAATEQWLAVVASQSDADDVAALRRAIIEHQTSLIASDFRDQAKVDRERLQRAASLVQTIADPLQPLPQPGLVLQWLTRDLPQEKLGSQDATRVARCLELSLRGDRVSQANQWWAPFLYGWLKDPMAQADRNRRLAGDLMIGEAEARERAEKYLNAAEQGYAEVDRVSATICDAAKVCQLGPLQLNRFRALLEARSVLPIDHEIEKAGQAVADLYRTVDQLDRWRTDNIPGDAQKREQALQQIANDVATFQQQYDRLAQQLNGWQQETFSASDGNVAEALAALSITGGSGDARLSTWRQLRRRAANPGGLSEPDVMPQVAASLCVQAGAALRGRLALAAWPAKAFDNLVDVRNGTRAQVEHRLNVFPSDREWWLSLRTAGWQIGDRETAARQFLGTTETDRPKPSPSVASSTRWLLDRLTVPALDWRELLRKERDRQLAPCLQWQADRFEADQYWSIQTGRPPYYQRVCRLLREDIASLTSHAPDTRGDTSGTTGDDASSDARETVQIRSADELVWTTQQRDSLDVTVQSLNHDNPGFVALWVTATGQVKVTQPVAGQRVCRPLATEQPPRRPRDPAAAETLLVHMQSSGDIESAQGSSLQVNGYFRGRRLQRKIAVKYDTTPDIHVVQSPEPEGGRIAICDDAGHASVSQGAVTFVLDCSGSMGAERGQIFDASTKYAQAVQAVETILRDLPQGTSLSIWTFGQAMGDTKTANPAERTIRRVVAPQKWNPKDKAMREDLLQAIRFPQLEPWNESPLIATMLTAANDLRDQEGLCSLVVITDGADNRVAHDTVTNPLGLSAEALIKERLGGTGITVNVVGFRVDDAEKLPVRRQLASVEELIPAGRFVLADQAKDLANAMRDMLSIQPTIKIRKAPGSQNETPTTVASVPLSPSMEAANWTKRLPAGLYSIGPAKASGGSLLELQDGDQLVLQRSANEPFCGYSPFRTDLDWCEQRSCGTWQLGLVRVPLSAPHLQRRQLYCWTPSDGTLAVERPREIWITARDGEQSLPIHWRTNRQQSGVVFDIDVETTTGSQPSFHVWIASHASQPVGSLQRDRDFLHLQDLAPSKWQVSDGAVRLLSAEIESHRVADRQGNLSEQPCLVLRLSLPSGSHYRLRSEGLKLEGQDEQFFSELGRYTLRQWPVTAATVERTLKSLHLISVEQFRLDVNQTNGEAIFAAPERTSQTAAASPWQPQRREWIAQ